MKLLLLYLILLIFIRQIISEEVCYGDNPISLDINVLGAPSIAVIFIECNIFAQFVGTVISYNKIITAASPIANLNETQITISLEHSATCPQLPPKGKTFKVVKTYFPKNYFPAVACHDVVILEVDGNLLDYGAEVAEIDLTEGACENYHGKEITTFKCLEDNEGYGSFQSVDSLIIQSSDSGCMIYATDIDEVCGPIGAPVIYNNKLIGVENYCHPNCAPISGASCLESIKGFIKKVLYEDPWDNPISIAPHVEIYDFIDNCEYKPNSPVIVELKRQIKSSHVCDVIIKGLLDIIDEHVPFSFLNTIVGMGIPPLLTWEQCPCKYNTINNEFLGNIPKNWNVAWPPLR